MEIKGYLIGNQYGDYLGKRYYWYHHENFNDAWVHPEGELEGILAQSKGWDSKPTTIVRAIHDTDRKSTTLVGSPLNIQSLDIAQVRELLKRTS
jgi:hypothetical protein